ncbi:hypothetical protein CFOL_v3_29215 [Cephalotus follicularis]|uniref:Uncharacterized protein n=1 Tax=Cephalotus follicularis TaxID=3775 RepID=A0A1Q3D061_CEPFO|nr:hypothetical protein CFOL_v3_29215 [Cephalotus follicularis]
MNDDDIILCVLNGLPPSYRKFSSSGCIRACTSTLTLKELHMLLVCEEISLSEESSHVNPVALMANRSPKANPGLGSSSNCRAFSNTRGGYQNKKPPSQQSSTQASSRGHNSRVLLSSNQNRLACQICNKTGLSTFDCWHRMDFA